VGGTVTHMGRQGHFDDLVGTGFVLIARTDPVAALSPQSAALLRDLGGIAIGYKADGDTDGTYGRWLDQLGADAVLVRPDFYVFGTASGVAAADDLLRALAPFCAPPVTIGTDNAAPIGSDQNA
jgi:hypothetical protein